MTSCSTWRKAVEPHVSNVSAPHRDAPMRGGRLRRGTYAKKPQPEIASYEGQGSALRIRRAPRPHRGPLAPSTFGHVAPPDSVAQPWPRSEAARSNSRMSRESYRVQNAGIYSQPRSKRRYLDMPRSKRRFLEIETGEMNARGRRGTSCRSKRRCLRRPAKRTRRFER